MLKSQKTRNVKNKQVSAKNQIDLNIKNRQVENIKKTNQIPKNKITKNHKVKKSQTDLHDSFQIIGVSEIKHSSLMNKTELNKNHENFKLLKSKGVRIISTDPDDMLSKDKDKVKHSKLIERETVKGKSNPKELNIHEVFVLKPGTKSNRSEKSFTSHIPFDINSIDTSAIKRRSKSLDKIPFSRVVGVQSKVKNIISPFMNFSDKNVRKKCWIYD